MERNLKADNTCIRNIIKTGKIKDVDDSQALRFGTVEALGKNQTVNIFGLYGILYNPPVGSLSLSFASQGQESKQVVISDDPNNRTLKNLAPGEIAITNYLTQDYIRFQADGTLEIKSASGSYIQLQSSGDIVIESVSNTINIANSDVNISNGTTTVTGGDVIADGISLKTHVHGGITPGGANTGTPV